MQQSETPYDKTHKDEQEHVTVARALQKYIIKARLARLSFPIKFPTLNPKPSTTQQPPATTSKILPFICPKTAYRNGSVTPVINNPAFQKTVKTNQSQPIISVPNESHSSLVDSFKLRPQKFPAAGAPPYIPVRHCNPHNRMAPPVTMRNMIPVFSAPPLPSPQAPLVMRPPASAMASPVCVRQSVPAFAAAPVRVEELKTGHPPIKVEDPRISKPITAQVEKTPFSRAAPGRLEDLAFARLPLARVEEPIGFKLLPVSVAPHSEVLRVQVEPPVPTVSTSPPASLKASVEENRIAVKDKLQELAEIEDLKDLKI